MEKDYSAAAGQQNIYAMSPQEREQLGIRSLPQSLRDALDAMEQDDLIRATLGNTFILSSCARKRLSGKCTARRSRSGNWTSI